MCCVFGLTYFVHSLVRVRKSIWLICVVRKFPRPEIAQTNSPLIRCVVLTNSSIQLFRAEYAVFLFFSSPHPLRVNRSESEIETNNLTSWTVRRRALMNFRISGFLDSKPSRLCFIRFGSKKFHFCFVFSSHQIMIDHCGDDSASVWFPTEMKTLHFLPFLPFSHPEIKNSIELNHSTFWQFIHSNVLPPTFGSS